MPAVVFGLSLTITLPISTKNAASTIVTARNTSEKSPATCASNTTCNTASIPSANVVTCILGRASSSTPRSGSRPSRKFTSNPVNSTSPGPSSSSSHRDPYRSGWPSSPQCTGTTAGSRGYASTDATTVSNQNIGATNRTGMTPATSGSP